MSMKLQYDNHLRQQRVLKEKWKRYEVQHEKLKEERAQKLKELESQGAQVENMFLAVTSGDVVDGKPVNCSQTNSLVISAENFSVSSISSCSEGAAKDEQESINSRIQELQMQILSLSEALEDANRENTKLKKTINSIKAFVQNSFGYELHEAHLPEEDTTDIHAPASLVDMDLNFPGKDILGSHACASLEEMELGNSSGAISSFSVTEPTVERLCSEDANAIEEYQPKNAPNNNLCTGKLDGKTDSSQHKVDLEFQEGGRSQEQLGSITLAPLETPKFDFSREEES